MGSGASKPKEEPPLLSVDELVYAAVQRGGMNRLKDGFESEYSDTDEDDENEDEPVPEQFAHRRSRSRRQIPLDVDNDEEHTATSAPKMPYSPGQYLASYHAYVSQMLEVARMTELFNSEFHPDDDPEADLSELHTIGNHDGEESELWHESRRLHRKHMAAMRENAAVSIDDVSKLATGPAAVKSLVQKNSWSSPLSDESELYSSVVESECQHLEDLLLKEENADAEKHAEEIAELKKNLNILEQNCTSLEKNSIQLKPRPACRGARQAYLDCITDPIESATTCHALALAYSECASEIENF
mmetsp:Transcript_51799/g.130039  ORF Transcript_51799/g.130039 Transcript_51799/m.130039 type:complete len:301 (-) Transcript_51799:24-926(-)